MVSFDAGATPADRFRAHFPGSDHLYAVAVRAMAQDWEDGGPVRQILAGYEDAPSGSVLQLRLLGGVFRIVLDGRADELAPWYACLGGTELPSTVWPALRRVLAAHVDELHAALAVAPQTNEVGRSVPLLVGLLDLAARTGATRVRLLELGASAGLNLLLDRFRIEAGGPGGPDGGGWAWGPVDSPVRLTDAVEGPLEPRPFTVVDRAGCDLYPVDATTPDGARLLTSFVWPFDRHRHARLAAALEVARAHPVAVDAGSAGEWLPGRLAVAAQDADTVLTVVWHSITQLYWPPAEVAAVDALLAAHGARHRVAEVAMEYPGADKPSAVLTTRLWRPETDVEERVLGTTHDHGVPVRLGAWSPLRARARPAGRSAR